MNLAKYAKRGLVHGAHMFIKTRNGKIHVSNNNVQTDAGGSGNSTRQRLSIRAYYCLNHNLVFWPVMFLSTLVYIWIAFKSSPYKQPQHDQVSERDMYSVQRLDDTLNKISKGTFEYSYKNWTKNYPEDTDETTPNKGEVSVQHQRVHTDEKTHIEGKVSDQQQRVGLSLPDQIAANERHCPSNFTTPIDKHDYKYIHNPETLCIIGPKKVFLLIMITSAPMNAARRDNIRSIYGKPNVWLGLLNRNSIVQVVFLLGKTNDLTLQTDIDKEYDLHGDIIQEDFVDSDNNLTMKTVMGLKWVTNHCRQALRVMKCDDTSVIIQPKFFASLANAPTSNWAGGRVHMGFPVLRDSKHKCYVSEELYSSPIFPPFLNEHGYILSTDLVESLYKVAITTPLFPWEDVFIGVCLEKLNITPNNIKDFVKYVPEGWLAGFQDDPSKKQMIKKFSVMYSLDPREMTMVWTNTKVTR